MALQAPSSEVDICNLALIHLKQEIVTSIDGSSPTTAEGLCATLYQQVRRATLRSHPWNFAMFRIILTTDALVTPAFGFSIAFKFPNDFVRFASRESSDLGFKPSPNEYTIEGRYIFTTGSTTDKLYLRYVRDIEAVLEMDPLFIDLFAINMALHLAPNFSGSEQRTEVLEKRKLEVEAQARAIDGQERPPKRIQTSKFNNARRHTSAGHVAGPNTTFR